MGASPFLGLPDERPRVGDSLMVSETWARGFGHRQTTVVRVGRQYGYVERYGREVAFNLSTGYLKDGRGRVQTQAALDDAQHRSDLIEEIKRYGFVRDWTGRSESDYPTETLEALVAVLRESPVTPKKERR